MIVGWQWWGLVMSILAVVFASDVWQQLDDRLAEAKSDSKGFETKLEWTLAIKTTTLLMLIGIIMVITGYSMGELAPEAINYFN